MGETPPDPRTQTEHQRDVRRRGILRIALIIVGSLVILAVCSLSALSFLRGLLDVVTPNLSISTAQAVAHSSQISPALKTPPLATKPSIPSTLAATFTSPPPTDTSTPEATPTAVPLPIRENFDQQYSDVWIPIGNPIIANGFLVNSEGQWSGIWTGNQAWKDYVVTFRTRYDGELIIGLRAQDPNYMIQLRCGGWNCKWVIETHQEEIEVGYMTQIVDQGVQITVKGDTFTSSDNYGRTMHLIIPPKYKGMFDSGGVFINLEIPELDYIQIDALP
jgi:hypothetical protein